LRLFLLARADCITPIIAEVAVNTWNEQGCKNADGVIGGGIFACCGKCTNTNPGWDHKRRARRAGLSGSGGAARGADRTEAQKQPAWPERIRCKGLAG